MFLVWLYCAVMFQVLIGGVCAIAELSFIEASIVSLIGASLSVFILYQITKEKH